jgi:hypothetical protein
MIPVPTIKMTAMRMIVSTSSKWWSMNMMIMTYIIMTWCRRWFSSDIILRSTGLITSNTFSTWWARITSNGISSCRLLRCSCCSCWSIIIYRPRLMNTWTTVRVLRTRVRMFSTRRWVPYSTSSITRCWMFYSRMSSFATSSLRSLRVTLNCKDHHSK